MGKTRSSGRMRNCKSRNKRGGGFRMFISPEKLKFKELNEMGNKDELRKYIVSFVNGSPDKIPLLYDELNEHDKDKLRSCIVDGLISGEISNADNIRNLSTDYSNTKQGILMQAKQEKEQKTNQDVTPVLAPFGIGHREESSGRIPDESDMVLGPQKSKFSPGGFFKPRAPTILPENVGEFQKRVNSSLAQGGSKSKRRHRRGRTLHKRRKSSKVRKTRRTHSRSRR